MMGVGFGNDGGLVLQVWLKREGCSMGLVEGRSRVRVVVLRVEQRSGKGLVVVRWREGDEQSGGCGFNDGDEGVVMKAWLMAVMKEVDGVGRLGWEGGRDGGGKMLKT
ncbi:hypothetical protein V6N11_021802 [Hibiscus sabdariffa]|uniref:Uncharacterized protein n=1 Tax=Hibiscus sabdariffa TaxID=183260 RepID=A0ABR2TI97_9ROSI